MPNDYLIGTGIYDVTGPAAELGMMGMASIEQKTEGIHSRLFARAFIVVTKVRISGLLFCPLISGLALKLLRWK